jgi:hypothetical protein
MMTMGDHDWVAIALGTSAIAMSLWSLWITHKSNRLQAALRDRAERDA